MSKLLGTTSLVRMQQIPIPSLPAQSRNGKQVIEDALLGGPEETLLVLRGKQVVKSTHSHQVYRSLILKRPHRSLHPMLTKAHRRLTHTMVYA